MRRAAPRVGRRARLSDPTTVVVDYGSNSLSTFFHIAIQNQQLLFWSAPRSPVPRTRTAQTRVYREPINRQTVRSRCRGRCRRSRPVVFATDERLRVVDAAHVATGQFRKTSAVNLLALTDGFSFPTATIIRLKLMKDLKTLARRAGTHVATAGVSPIIGNIWWN